MMKWWVKKGGCHRDRAKELPAEPEDGAVNREVSRELAARAAHIHSHCVYVGNT